MKNGKRYLRYIPLVLFFCFEIYYFVFLNKNIDMLISSDDSSELLLGQLLAQENRIISPNWYYSTELRFLNTNLIYAPLFKVFHSWHTIRMVSLGIMHLIMAVAVWYLCRKMEKMALFPMILFMVMLPLSAEYNYIVHQCAYYIPYIVISMFGFGFVFGYVKSDDKMKRKIYLVLSILLGLLSCVGGARQVVVFYLPLVMCSIILLLIYQKKREEAFKTLTFRFSEISFASFFGAAVGFVINQKVMHRFCSFRSWNVKYTFFQPARLMEVLEGMAEFYGFRAGAMNLKNTLTYLVMVILLIGVIRSVLYAIRYKEEVSREYYLFAVFFSSALLTIALLFSLTSMYFQTRYMFPVLMLSFFLIAMWISESKWIPNIRHYVYAGYILTVCLGVILVYHLIRMTVIMNHDEHTELMNIAGYLEESEYYKGYSTFWSANILTEYTDGVLDIHHWNDEYLQDVYHVDDTYEWLQVVSHSTEKPEGKVFILLSYELLEKCNWKDALTDDCLIFDGEYYRVFGFSDYQSMIRKLGL